MDVNPGFTLPEPNMEVDDSKDELWQPHKDFEDEIGTESRQIKAEPEEVPIEAKPEEVQIKDVPDDPPQKWETFTTAVSKWSFFQQDTKAIFPNVLSIN